MSPFHATWVQLSLLAGVSVVGAPGLAHAQGQTWQFRPGPELAYCRQIQVFDRQHIWILADIDDRGGYRVSHDGGATFLPLHIPGVTRAWELTAVDEKRAFMLAGQRDAQSSVAYLWFTDDGGESWEQRGQVPIEHNAFFAGLWPSEDGREVRIRTGEGLFLSTDGGLTVESLSSADGVTLAQYGHGLWFAVDGQTNHLLRSKDDGRTFEVVLETVGKAQESLGELGEFGVVYVATPQHAYVHSRLRGVLETWNGGETWQLAPLPERGGEVPRDISEVAFDRDGVHGVMTMHDPSLVPIDEHMRRSIVSTHDGGLTWEVDEIDPSFHTDTSRVPGCLWVDGSTAYGSSVSVDQAPIMWTGSAEEAVVPGGGSSSPGSEPPPDVAPSSEPRSNGCTAGDPTRSQSRTSLATLLLCAFFAIRRRWGSRTRAPGPGGQLTNTRRLERIFQ